MKRRRAPGERWATVERTGPWCWLVRFYQYVDDGHGGGFPTEVNWWERLTRRGAHRSARRHLARQRRADAMTTTPEEVR